MMATTHALVGFALAAVASAAGVPSAIAVPAAVLGSVAPDFDLYAGHRRTLHYPVLFPLAALLSAGVALTAGTPLSLALTVFFAGAAGHTTLDVLGGGLELRPWEGTSERAVYDHVRARWIPPRRLVRYDGAPEDLLLATALSAGMYGHYVGPARALILALLAVSVVYVALRRPLAALAPRVASALPADVRRHVPERYLDS